MSAAEYVTLFVVRTLCDAVRFDARSRPPFVALAAETVIGAAAERETLPLIVVTAFLPWNTTRSPAICETVAVTDCTPAVSPSVHVTCAWPEPSVLVEVALSFAVGSDADH